MNDRQVQTILNRLGFPCGAADGVIGPRTRAATARFQLACNLPGHDKLVVDGIPGAKTKAALDSANKTGRLSRHFWISELRSKGDGTAYVHRDLLAQLERLRSAVGRPVPIISAYRDVAHNRRVGGASQSQHTFGAATELRGRVSGGVYSGQYAGRAADIPSGLVTLSRARSLRLFTGLGYRGAWVTHVDVRTGRSTAAPATWPY